MRRAHGDGRAPGSCAQRVVVSPRMSAYSKEQGGVRESRTPPLEGLSIRGLPRCRGLRVSGADQARRAAAQVLDRRFGDHRGVARSSCRCGAWPTRRPVVCRRRARLPAPVAGRAAMGRRPDHGRQAPGARHPHRRRGRAARRAGARRTARAGVGAPPARARAQPRSAARAGRAATRIDRLAARAGARLQDARRDRRDRRSSTGARLRGADRCRTLVRLRFGVCPTGPAPSRDRVHAGHPRCGLPRRPFGRDR